MPDKYDGQGLQKFNKQDGLFDTLDKFGHNVAYSSPEGQLKRQQQANTDALSKLGQSINGYLQPAQQSAQKLTSELGSPGPLEQYYAQMQNQTNPYFNRLRNEGQGRLAQMFAAQGATRSGAQNAAQSRFLADTNAAESQQMASLAQGAQSAQQGRLGAMFGANLGLGTAQAGLSSDLTKFGINESDNLLGMLLQNQLAQRGYDAQQSNQLMQYVLGGAKIIAPFAEAALV